MSGSAATAPSSLDTASSLRDLIRSDRFDSPSVSVVDVTTVASSQTDTMISSAVAPINVHSPVISMPGGFDFPSDNDSGNANSVTVESSVSAPVQIIGEQYSIASDKSSKMDLTENNGVKTDQYAYVDFSSSSEDITYAYSALHDSSSDDEVSANGTELDQTIAQSSRQSSNEITDNAQEETETEIEEDIEDPYELSSSPPIEDESDIDYSLVYALHAFHGTETGHAEAEKGDAMLLLDDSNHYWWLVQMMKNGTVGYLPAEIIETPTERLARLNKYRNSSVYRSN
ncbi:uncharacterized protein V1516DRAFT_75669 [Lipomyces oligophaga]|uniref:uncharacterized protein n=1 Tax=Lipomyces oligophaga TaxID=45792 RepID=UPI0034CECA30